MHSNEKWHRWWKENAGEDVSEEREKVIELLHRRNWSYDLETGKWMED